MRFFQIFLLLLVMQIHAMAGDTLRVMTYNLLNYGNITSYCTSTNNSFVDKEPRLRRIVAYVQPDILGVCELGSNSFVQQRLLDSVMNRSGAKTYAKSATQNQAGSDLVSMLYYNSDKLALQAQYSINTQVRDIVLYRLYYRDPLLSQTHDTAFIHCIVAHLKAGSSTSDKNERATMTQNAMQWIAQYGGIGNYLFMGDFNIQSSSETSYQNLISYSNSSLSFQDPISKNGSWHTNSSMAAYHTQSTHSSSNGCAAGGGMDDRFDFILASGPIMQGSQHVRYIPGSYTTVGNDGQHYNSSINSGSNNSAPESIINDLYDMSDHLPLYLDLVLDQQGASIENDRKRNILVRYNNPVINELRLNFPATNSEQYRISCYAADGFLIRKDVFSGSNYTLNMHSLPSGLYLIHIQNKNGQCKNIKIIKP